MKHSILKITLLLCCLLTVTSARAKDSFATVKQHPSVESVHINRFMMSVMRSAVKMSGDKDAINAMRGIKAIDIIECDKRSAIPEVKARAHKAIETDNYELLVETREKDEHVIIYSLSDSKSKNKSLIKDPVIEVSEPGEYCLLIIKGTIDPTTFNTKKLK
ncbi:MAG: DUF4252 domain-containing protein [Muribaculaceae bacterium]|nr:DUF4252 domain-containing protein [Muribaculaceae bacterium]